MNNSMMLITMFMSLLTAFSQHPIIMVILISFQSLMVALMITFSLFTQWFSLVLFLVFMGGLMVLFIYVSSLASNEEFTQERNLSYTIMFMTLPIVLSGFMMTETPKILSKSLNIKKIILKLYSDSNIMLTFMLMLYLLIVLIISVNVISMYEGPLRSMTTLK